MSLGAPEILVVLIVALIVLGPERLPGAARQMGKAMQEFRKITADVTAEFHDALAEEPVPMSGDIDLTEKVQADKALPNKTTANQDSKTEISATVEMDKSVEGHTPHTSES